MYIYKKCVCILCLDLNFDVPGFTQIPTGDNSQLPSHVGDSGCSFQSEKKAGVVASEEGEAYAWSSLKGFLSSGPQSMARSCASSLMVLKCADGGFGSSLHVHNVKLPLQLRIKLGV